MHKSSTKRLSPLEPSKLLQVFSSPWWQLDANHRELIARHREPLPAIIARLFDHDYTVRVIRGEEPASGDEDEDEHNQ